MEGGCDSSRDFTMLESDRPLSNHMTANEFRSPPALAGKPLEFLDREEASVEVRRLSAHKIKLGGVQKPDQDRPQVYVCRGPPPPSGATQKMTP